MDTKYGYDEATCESLAAQFTENTGRHMLDSGGAYGRGWERKAGMTAQDFIDKPRAYADDYSLSISAFHWLADRLQYEPVLDAKFEKWAWKDSRKDDPWLVNAEAWAEKRHDEWGDNEGVRCVNTYNGDSNLDEVLQYVTWYDRKRGERLILLQTHNGCDVRGGYSRPRVYSFRGWEGEYEMYREDIEVYCPGPDESDTQDEQFEGMPEREDMSHGWTHGVSEIYDHDGGEYWGAYSDDTPYENKEGHIMCRTHNVECSVEMGATS